MTDTGPVPPSPPPSAPTPGSPTVAGPGAVGWSPRRWWESVRPSLSPPSRRVAAGTAVAAGAVVLLVVVAYIRLSASGPAPELVLPRAVPAGGPGGPTSVPTSVAATVTLHVAGAVARPGIYVLPATARVADAVTAAGGPVAEADLDRVNLATKVADGDRVFMPRKGETPPALDGLSGHGGRSTAPRQPSATDPVDLNTADEDRLQALPGVGPATARAILTHRSRIGRFGSVDELLDVPGIGPAKLETLRPLVRV